VTALDLVHPSYHNIPNLFKAERSRRAEKAERTQRRIRYCALWKRVCDGKADPTPATRSLLGAGIFLLDRRCLEVHVESIIVWAA
jgi:hypothetical protein